MESAERKKIIGNILLGLFLASFMLIIIPPVKLWWLDFYTKYDGYLRAFFVSVTAIVFLINIIDKKSVEPVLLLCALYCAVIVASTLLNGGGLKEALWGKTVVPLMIICIIDLCMNQNSKLTVSVLFAEYSIIILINLFTVWNFSKTGLNISKLTDYAFLGNRNTFIFYYLIVLFCGYYGIQRRYINSRWMYYAIYAACIMTTFLARGLATTFVLVLWGLFFIFNDHLELNRLFRFVFPLILFLFVFLQSFDGTNSNIILSFLSAVGKNEFFSGRVPIWKNSRELIKASPVIGYGVVDYMKAVGNAHPHNLYLHIAIAGGAAGSFIVLIMLFYYGKAVMIIKKKKIAALFMFFIFVFMLESLVDMADITYNFLYISLLYYFCRDELQAEGA